METLQEQPIGVVQIRSCVGGGLLWIIHEFWFRNSLHVVFSFPPFLIEVALTYHICWLGFNDEKPILLKSRTIRHRIRGCRKSAAAYLLYISDPGGIDLPFVIFYGMQVH
jgi:hypothetical protein